VPITEFSFPWNIFAFESICVLKWDLGVCIELLLFLLRSNF
jgi:hypothetical protein